MTLSTALLANRDEHTERVRCPVHGFIHYSRAEREIIDHWSFQRLRNIKQLALCHYVYPGAMHTRFEHSLGVMEMATRAFDSITRKQEKTVTGELQKVQEFRKETLKRAKQILRLYALLHDAGHPPFSHVGEDSIPGKDHEKISLHVVEKHVSGLLDSLFFEGAGNLIARMMKKSPEFDFLRHMIAGEIDMDRTDYLRRDSLHCGVDYGRFDFLRLIESLNVTRNRYDGRLQLALERGGEHTFEALILARYQMTTQVYFHRIRRIYDHYVKKYMALWAQDHLKTFDDVLQYDDIQPLADIARDSKSDNERTKWAKRIHTREHHKVVYETGDSATAQQLKDARLIYDALKQEFTSVDFILDNAEGSIHKQTLPDQHDEEKVDELYVVDRNGRNQKLITRESAILRKIDRKFRSVRIYADADEGQLDKIRAAARNAEKE